MINSIPRSTSSGGWYGDDGMLTTNPVECIYEWNMGLAVDYKKIPFNFTDITRNCCRRVERVNCLLVQGGSLNKSFKNLK